MAEVGGWSFLALLGAKAGILEVGAGAMFFKLRATAGTTVGEGEEERRGEDGERLLLWGDGVRDESGCCRGRGVNRDLQVEN